MFEPDILEYVETRQPRMPELRLMRAVLESGIRAALGDGGLRVKQEATEWIHSDDQQHPFSFLNICTRLDLSPDYVHRLLSFGLRPDVKKTMRAD